MEKIKLAVFASTRGTDLQALIEAIKAGELAFADLKFVLSNKEECGAVEKAKAAGIKTYFVNPPGKTREEYDGECLKICRENGIDLILLVGYMRIMTSVIIEPYRKRIMNIHPSLLPKYPGMDLNVHAEVLKNGEKESGCTLHFVTEELDSGPVILQKKVEVSENETPESLKAKVQLKEQEAILEGLKLFAGGKLV